MELYEPQLIAGAKVFKPGVYDLSNEDYHASAGISRSGISELKRSPLHYWDKYINPDKPAITESKSLKFGTAVHTYLLERPLFDKHFIVPPDIDKRTKKGKETWDAFMDQYGGKRFITRDELAIIKAIADAIEKHPTASDLIKDAVYEKSIYWIDKASGLLCKARPDIWHSNMIVDLKTTDSGVAEDFQRSIHNYDYYIQAAMCIDAVWHAAFEEHENFLFIVAEKERPFAVCSYPLKAEAIWQGRHEYQRELMKLRECFEKNEWPGYPDQEVTLPPYALRA